MELRGVKSDKQILLSALEKSYVSATSEQNFYQQLSNQNLELYSRNGNIVGIKMNRKYRFKTMGYTKDILENLNRQLSKNNRLGDLQRIRERQKGRSRNKDR